MINTYIKVLGKLGNIDGYDEYEDNLWKEITKGKRTDYKTCVRIRKISIQR